MNHCPTAQIVLCTEDKCSMYCPNASMVLKGAVQLNWIGSGGTAGGAGSSTTSSTATVGAAGLETQQRKEGYCIDSEGNRSAC